MTRSAHVDRSLDRDLLRGEIYPETQSFFSEAGPRSKNKILHPGTFPERDAERLIRGFSREGELVLDPFLGTGTTAVACETSGRSFVGVELYEEWAEIARERAPSWKDSIHVGDSLDVLRDLAVCPDLLLTSPPYGDLLMRAGMDHKTQRERGSLPKDYGDNDRDLGLIQDYERFLEVLGDHGRLWYGILRERAYALLVLGDYRRGSRYTLFHADVARVMEERAGFTLQGLMVMVQDSKRLYPYGYPHTFVPNVVNQFVVILRKLA